MCSFPTQVVSSWSPVSQADCGVSFPAWFLTVQFPFLLAIGVAPLQASLFLFLVVVIPSLLILKTNGAGWALVAPQSHLFSFTVTDRLTGTI